MMVLKRSSDKIPPLLRSGDLPYLSKLAGALFDLLLILLVGFRILEGVSSCLLASSGSTLISGLR